jgi:phosphonate dehydrogenase
MRPVVLVTQRTHPDVLALLERSCEVAVNDSARPLEPEELATQAAPASGLLVFMPDRIDRALLDRSPRLRVVAGAFKGADNVDTAACSARGIWVTVVPDLLSEPTAELAIALLLAAARRVREGDAFVRAGRFGGWRQGMHGMGLRGTPVGIVGAGAVGREIARLLVALGARPAYHDPGVDHVDGAPARPLEALLRESRALVLALPLSAGTERLIDAARIALVPPGAILVNVGRGSTVDEAAVAAALSSGHLAAYAADVFAMEDTSRGHRPAGIDPGLLAHPRSVFTPHLGTAIGDVRREIELSAARSILQALAGERPKGAVNDVGRAPRA